MADSYVNNIPERQTGVASALEELPESSEGVHGGKSIFAAMVTARQPKHEDPMPRS